MVQKKKAKKEQKAHRSDKKKNTAEQSTKKKNQRSKTPWIIAGVILLAIITALVSGIFFQKPLATADGLTITIDAEGELQIAPSNEIIEISKEEIDSMNTLYKIQGYSLSDRDLAEQLILRKVLYANSIEYAPTADAVAIEMDKIEESLAQFEESFFMENVGMTKEQILSDIEQWIASDMAIQQFLNQEILVSLPTEEVVEASHILICYNETGFCEQNRTKAEALQIASEILLEVTPENFAEVASATSDDTYSAIEGGALGEFPKGAMVPEFEETAFNLEIGEISNIVETDFGYHIILVTGKKTAPSRDAGLEIQYLLFEEIQNKTNAKYAPKLMKNSADSFNATSIN